MGTIADDLDAFAGEAEELGLDDLPSDAHATVLDLDYADRLLRAVRRLDRDRAALEAHAATERARIDEWLTDRTAGMTDRREELVRILDGFARAYKERTRHAPPPLVNGTIRLTAPRARVVVEDDAAFRDWAEGNGHLNLLRIKVDADKEALKQATKLGPEVGTEGDDVRHSAITPEGETVPGVAIVKSLKDSLSVTVAER